MYSQTDGQMDRRTDILLAYCRAWLHCSTEKRKKKTDNE